MAGSARGCQTPVMATDGPVTGPTGARGFAPCFMRFVAPALTEDACRDAGRRYVVRSLGDPGAVPAVYQTGFMKKGWMSAGVARMYTGTATDRLILYMVAAEKKYAHLRCSI